MKTPLLIRIVRLSLFLQLGLFIAKDIFNKDYNDSAKAVDLAFIVLNALGYYAHVILQCLRDDDDDGEGGGGGDGDTVDPPPCQAKRIPCRRHLHDARLVKTNSTTQRANLVGETTEEEAAS